jgi:hypothetical protein
MPLSVRELAQLQKIIGIVEKLITKASGSQNVRTTGAHRSAKTRTGHRRSGNELRAFRKMLMAERKRGVPVAQLAKKHGITPSYIYQL